MWDKGTFGGVCHTKAPLLTFDTGIRLIMLLILPLVCRYLGVHSPKILKHLTLQCKDKIALRI